MQPALIWLLLGLAQIAVDMLTGTFYLLILGIAAGIGALAAYLGLPFFSQALGAAIAAVAGGILVRRYHDVANASSPKNNANDIGELVVLESWISETQRHARVRYRGTTWDAEILGNDQVAAGAQLYVVAVEGSRLKVSAARPAAAV